jgi:hypothetical protein
VNTIKIAIQNSPATTKSRVSELSWRTCIKNHATKLPLITAMVIATTKLYSPNSTFETATVVIVSAIRIRKTVT